MIGGDMNKFLLVVAAVLVATVPVNWIWQAKAGRAEIDRENVAIDAVNATRELAYRQAVAETQAKRRHQARMELSRRHQREMQEMSERHERERLADRIAESLRPGSTGEAAMKRVEESSALMERQRRESAEMESAE